MSALKSLRERVAEAVRADGSDLCDRPWDTLPDEMKIGWLGDADRAIPVVAEAAARVAEQRDPEKPGNYLFKREQIGSAILGLIVGYDWPDDAEDGDLTEYVGSDLFKMLIETLVWVRKNYAGGSTAEINSRIDAAIAATPKNAELEAQERIVETLTGELRRVTDHLASWVEYHSHECTAEIDAAIYCARLALSQAEELWNKRPSGKGDGKQH